jgi:hypothetical protein
MNILTKELTGAALDWAVAIAEGLPVKRDPMGFKSGSEAGFWVWGDDQKGPMLKIGRNYQPSFDYAVGAIIIEREGIAVFPACYVDSFWCAIEDKGGSQPCRGYWQFDESEVVKGETMLVAAMRCYVGRVLGENIDVPDELMESK